MHDHEVLAIWWRRRSRASCAGVPHRWSAFPSARTNAIAASSSGELSTEDASAPKKCTARRARLQARGCIENGEVLATTVVRDRGLWRAVWCSTTRFGTTRCHTGKRTVDREGIRQIAIDREGIRQIAIRAARRASRWGPPTCKSSRRAHLIEAGAMRSMGIGNTLLEK